MHPFWQSTLDRCCSSSGLDLSWTSDLTGHRGTSWFLAHGPFILVAKPATDSYQWPGVFWMMLGCRRELFRSFPTPPFDFHGLVKHKMCHRPTTHSAEEKLAGWILRLRQEAAKVNLAPIAGTHSLGNWERLAFTRAVSFPHKDPLFVIFPKIKELQE